MVANTIFPLVLALGGPNNIQRVEVNESSAATSVLAYDDTGEVAAEIIVRRTGDGEVMLDALFPEWAMCAGKAVFAVASCSTAGLLWCAGSTFYAACECIEWASKGENSCTE